MEIILKFAPETPNVHTEELKGKRERDAVRDISTNASTYAMNFFDQHAGNDDDGQNLGPMNRRDAGGGWLKVEQEHVGEEQQEKAVEDLESAGVCMSLTCGDLRMRWRISRTETDRSSSTHSDFD